jgi:hypothetical protein
LRIKRKGAWRRYNARMEKQDKVLAAAVIARIEAAKAEIAVKMAEAGLREKDGWRLLEELRSTPDGTEFVFRPVHTRLDCPDIEATVLINADGCPI